MTLKLYSKRVPSIQLSPAQITKNTEVQLFVRLDNLGNHFESESAG